MALLKMGRAAQALGRAQAWLDRDPGDLMALLAVGEAHEALGQKPAAARAYGSIIDLYPGRADLRRAAGARLERLGKPWLPLIVDTYRKARSQRPDQRSGHRLLAFALVRAGQPAAAFDVVEAAWKQLTSIDFVQEIFAEDAGLIAAAWLRSEPQRRSEVLARLSAMKAILPTDRSLRFVMTCETGAGTIRFDVWRVGRESSSLSRHGFLLSDTALENYPGVYGVARFLAAGDALRDSYRLGVDSQGGTWTGNLLGKVEILEHDGRGNLRFEERPIVLMQDKAYLQLGFAAAKK